MKIYDDLLYSNKPSVVPYLETSLHRIGASELWNNQISQELPSRTHVESVIATVPQNEKYLVLNVEHWNIPGDVSKFRTLAQWVREALPVTCKLGYYAMLPKRDYWRAIQGPTNSGYIAWQAENTAMMPVLDFVDVLFPSVYTFYADREGWKTYAKANLSEALRMAGGREIIPYLYIKYHESNVQLSGQYIPRDYFEMQLNLVKREWSDGAVLFGGWQEQWDEQRDFWRVVKQFRRW